MLAETDRLPSSDLEGVSEHGGASADNNDVVRWSNPVAATGEAGDGAIGLPPIPMMELRGSDPTSAEERGAEADDGLFEASWHGRIEEGMPRWYAWQVAFLGFSTTRGGTITRVLAALAISITGGLAPSVLTFWLAAGKPRTYESWVVWLWVWALMSTCLFIGWWAQESSAGEQRRAVVLRLLARIGICCAAGCFLAWFGMLCWNGLWKYDSRHRIKLDELNWLSWSLVASLGYGCIWAGRTQLRGQPELDAVVVAHSANDDADEPLPCDLCPDCCCSAVGVVDMLVQISLLGVASLLVWGTMGVVCLNGTYHLGGPCVLFVSQGESDYSSEYYNSAEYKQKKMARTIFTLILVLTPPVCVLIARLMGCCATQAANNRRGFSRCRDSTCLERCLSIHTPVHTVHKWLRKFTVFAVNLFLVELWMVSVAVIVLAAFITSYHGLNKCITTPAGDDTICIEYQYDIMWDDDDGYDRRYRWQDRWQVPCTITRQAATDSQSARFVAELDCDGGASHGRRLQQLDLAADDAATKRDEVIAGDSAWPALGTTSHRALQGNATPYRMGARCDSIASCGGKERYCPGRWQKPECNCWGYKKCHCQQQSDCEQGLYCQYNEKRVGMCLRCPTTNFYYDDYYLDKDFLFGFPPLSNCSATDGSCCLPALAQQCSNTTSGTLIKQICKELENATGAQTCFLSIPAPLDSSSSWGADIPRHNARGEVLAKDAHCSSDGSCNGISVITTTNTTFCGRSTWKQMNDCKAAGQDDPCWSEQCGSSPISTRRHQLPFIVDTATGSVPYACLEAAPESIKATGSVVIRLLYQAWIVVVAVLSLLDRAFLMRMMSHDHLSTLFDDMFQYIGQSEYVPFEVEAMKRMKQTSRKFLLGVVLPTFLYILLVLLFSPSAQVLLSDLRDNYDDAMDYYQAGVDNGCESSDTEDCIAGFSVCEDSYCTPSDSYTLFNYTYYWNSTYSSSSPIVNGTEHFRVYRNWNRQKWQDLMWGNCSFPDSAAGTTCAERVAKAFSLYNMTLKPHAEYGYTPAYGARCRESQQPEYDEYDTRYYSAIPPCYGRSQWTRGYGDCCPEEPSYVLLVMIPMLALTWTFGQLFTPVLGSILLMMCVLQVHTLHLEGVLEKQTVGWKEQMQQQQQQQQQQEKNGEGDGGEAGMDVPAVIEEFAQVKDALEKTSVRWSIVLFIEACITVVIAIEPVLYSLARSNTKRAAASRSAELATAEAGVFFAATIPFVFVLVFGLIGIARLNERVNKIPATIESQLGDEWTMVQHAQFEEEFQRLEIGLRIYRLKISGVRVKVTTAILAVTIGVNIVVGFTS